MEKLQPTLRFPEFKGNWNSNTLGEIFNITSASRVHKNEWKENGVRFFRTSDVVSHFKGNENSKAFISFELYESLSKKIGKVKKNDILITGGGSIGIPYLIKDEEPLYFKDADLLWIKNNDEINGYFIYTYFLTESFRDYLNNISHTGTIAHYTVNQAKNTPLNFPSLPEQTKIANFLSSVDEKINLLKEKKALLEEYKKGMMQQIFSQQLRFKDEDGKDFEDWEEKSLGALMIENKQRNNGNKITEVFSVAKSKGVINQIEHLGRSYASDNISNYKVVLPNDIVYTKSPTTDFPYGIIKQNKLNRTGVVSVLYGIFTPINEYVGFLIHNYFEDWKNTYNYLDPIVQKGAKNTINIGNQTFLNGAKIFFPVDEKEQKKIASFLSAIDEKIELETQQIEDTQEYKKGLLQGMFC